MAMLALVAAGDARKLLQEAEAPGPGELVGAQAALRKLRGMSQLALPLATKRLLASTDAC